MSDEVKFIFKTLLKVPVIIVVSFIILNIFAFFFIYFKVLGLSYVVMQTAVENNYLPPTEVSTLNNYVKQWESTSPGGIPMVTESFIIVAKSGDAYKYYDPTATVYHVDIQNAEGSGGIFGSTRTYTPASPGEVNTALKKIQYGKSVTVGVHCGYRLVWPLGYKETINGVTSANADDAGVNGVEGFDTGKTFAGFKTDTQLEADRAAKETLIAFDITHNVPGLKYYPDLLSN